VIEKKRYREFKKRVCKSIDRYGKLKKEDIKALDYETMQAERDCKVILHNLIK
jgi:hypothetical protein